MNFRHVSTKVLPLGSCAFRQPYAQSHCRLIHGYRLQAKLWFTCDHLDENNWVLDFGALKSLKKSFEDIFDHKMAIWKKDPALETFMQMEKEGLVELSLFKDGVGIEKFAEVCMELANEFALNHTAGRVRCIKAEVWEHEGNSAIYEEVNEPVSDLPIAN